MPASSYHSGGVSVAMCDASVRFIADNIETGNPDDVLSTNDYRGESIRGVWGAMGTSAGGEVKSE